MPQLRTSRTTATPQAGTSSTEDSINSRRSARSTVPAPATTDASLSSQVIPPDAASTSQEPLAQNENFASPDASGGVAEDQTASSPRDRSARKRSVVHLSNTQLEKKRKNDRDAQRAIRERTKTRIEGLEAKVKELESIDSQKDLVEALRSRDELQAENEDLRKRLATVQAALHPNAPENTTINNSSNPSAAIDPALNENDRAKVAPTYSYPPPNYAASNQPWQAAVARMSWDSASTQAGWSPSTNFPGPDHFQQRPSLDSSARLSVDAMSNGHRHSVAHQSAMPSPRTMSTSTGYSAMSNPTGNGPPPNQDSMRQRGSPGATQTAMHPPARLPTNTNPTTNFDQILLDFIRHARQYLASGSTSATIFGPRELDMSPVLYPERYPNEQGFPLSLLLSRVTRDFGNVRRLPDKAAMVTCLYHFYRWIILGSQESLESVPAFMRPTDAQLNVPHAMWVDTLPWPSLRERIIYNYPSLSFSDIFPLISTSLMIDWPYGEDPSACVYSASEQETGPRGENFQNSPLRLLPQLQQCLRNLDNWSLGPDFADTFPDLATVVKIRGRGQ
ncbi:MAG: hypothetical protein M1831_004544 [Alyxoria varia]|nr:MAG: hypothetical protein M1831_004544 [Alyxoria varia]